MFNIITFNDVLLSFMMTWAKLGLEHQLPSPQAFQTGFKVKAKGNRLHLSLKANLSWESLLKQKDSLPAVNDMRRVERLHHKTLYQALTS